MGFANPIALAFAALYAVLIALYLWERHRRRIEVPSLLLWQAVPDAVVRTARFRPEPLFFLQLLLLTLLIAALARPHLGGSSADDAAVRHIFVLDASASMQAREGRHTRFEQARRSLRRRLERLPPPTEVMLVVAAHHPFVALPFTRDRDAVRRKLDELEPVDTGTNLDLALAVARRASEHSGLPTRIELWTDASIDELPDGWQSHAGVRQLGETDDNLAIDGLQIFQGRFQDHRSARAQIYVHNFSHREAHGFLTVTLADEVLSRRGFSLAARAVRSFSVRDFPRPGIVRVDLEVDDALAADNRAWGWVRPARTLEVAVVSASPPFVDELQALARATPNLRFRPLTPDEYEGSAPGADVVVFDRLVPAAPPATPSLYLFPESGAEGFTLAGEAAGLRVVDWNERHPALQGMHPAFAYPLHAARLVEVQPWMDVLLRTRHEGREFPLAFAGERNGRRVAGMAFDLAAERLLHADNVSLLLLFLGTLQWLAPPEQEVSVLRTGDVHVLENLPRQPRRIVDPRSRATTLPEGESVRIEALYTGEYRVRVDGTERRLLANLFDAAESDIGRASKLPFDEPPLRGAQHSAAAQGRPLALWLCLLAAAAFAIEWCVAWRST